MFPRPSATFARPNSETPRVTYDKRREPQLVVEGKIIPKEEIDLVIFNIDFWFFQLTCIVNVPPDGETKAPVYIKCNIRDKPSTVLPAIEELVMAVMRRGVQGFQGVQGVQGAPEVSHHRSRTPRPNWRRDETATAEVEPNDDTE